MSRNFKLFQNEKIEFGPKDLVDQRKGSRPFSPRCPIFVTIKANDIIFFEHSEKVEAIIEDCAESLGIKVYGKALNMNHAHLLVQAQTHDLFKTFLRVINSKIARRLKGKGLFPQRPHTRLVHWGRDFRSVTTYIRINQLEGKGFNRKTLRRDLEWREAE